ncbi:permease-like cell division protein FtsX [Paenibacillus sp. GCM10023252]|uniref:permease-like cell division protein FtsX n=1 Tax=Paenibacillus sp. GCM10023252 TaxID=3252649 RepID=UPI003606D784
MKLRTISRHIREGLRNIIRNGWMSFASMSSIFISLFILGVFLLLAINVNNLASQVESKVEIKVYLQLDVEEAKMNELKNQIGNMPEVAEIILVTKEEALRNLQESLGKDGEMLLEDYKDDNPLPFTYTVRVYDPVTVGDVAKKIEEINLADPAQPISKVRYGQGPVEVMFKITDIMRNVGLVMVAGLAVTAMFLISNTIKMTIIARRREIGIMKLVGATNSFIRWPFFIEGALIGLLSSLFTVAVILFGYDQLVQLTQARLALILKLVSVKEAGLLVGSLLIALGTLIGIWGSTLSIRKYLKV